MPSAGSQETVRVLLIEADAGGARKIQEDLSAASPSTFQLDRVGTLAAGLEALVRGGVDVVLLDRKLPDGRGLDDLLQVQSLARGVPVVLLSDCEDLPAETAALSNGAQDFLVKERLNARAMARILRSAIERQRVRTALEQAVMELKELNQMKTDFISSVSHELHTPLTVITVAVNNFIDGIFGKLDELQLKWMQRVRSNAERLTILINDILDLSKLQSGRAKLNWKRFNLCETVQKVIDDIQPLAQEKGLKFLREIPSEPVEVFAAQTRIEQVVVNLFTNALKYTPAGGRVSVRLERRPEEVRVEVADTGAGVDPSKLEIIFERFLQLGEDKTAVPGIGLGLAICKEIILLHQGRIWAESEGIGRGSRFIFTLPVDLKPSSFRKPTVLVVDNDPDVLDVLTSILEGMNYNVILARDGAEGIAAIVSSGMHTPIDLLIADLILPVRDGLEVIKEMKRVNPQAFVVMITGYSNHQLLSRAVEYSSFTILKKPFEVNEIKRILGSMAISVLEPRPSGERR